jgi:anti-sigma28 factor (negative regulator of flagellin synthesis)
MIDSIGPGKPDFSLLRSEKLTGGDVPARSSGGAEPTRPLTSLSSIASSSRIAGPMPYDTARVEVLAQAIHAGTYRLDADRTAAALMTSLAGKSA